MSSELPCAASTLLFLFWSSPSQLLPTGQPLSSVVRLAPGRKHCSSRCSPRGRVAGCWLLPYLWAQAKRLQMPHTQGCPSRHTRCTPGAALGQPRARCQRCHSSGAEQCEPPALNIRSGVIPRFCAQMGCTQSQNYSSPTARRPSGVHADPWQTMWVFTTLPALTSALHPSQKLLPASCRIGELQERQRAAAPQQRAPAVNHQ